MKLNRLTNWTRSFKLIATRCNWSLNEKLQVKFAFISSKISPELRNYVAICMIFYAVVIYVMKHSSCTTRVCFGDDTFLCATFWIRKKGRLCWLMLNAEFYKKNWTQLKHILHNLFGGIYCLINWLIDWLTFDFDWHIYPSIIHHVCSRTTTTKPW